VLPFFKEKKKIFFSDFEKFGSSEKMSLSSEKNHQKMEKIGKIPEKITFLKKKVSKLHFLDEK
jgi:hypothetical protein